MQDKTGTRCKNRAPEMFPFHNRLCSLWHNQGICCLFHFLLFFTLWSAGTSKPTRWRVLFIFLTKTRSGQDCVDSLNFKIPDKFVSHLLGRILVSSSSSSSSYYYYYYYYYYYCEFFIPALVDGLFLEWLQVSSGLQDSSQYSDWSL